MTTFKRFLASFLVLSQLCAMTTLAVETTQSNTQSSSYAVTIPESVDFGTLSHEYENHVTYAVSVAYAGTDTPTLSVTSDTQGILHNGENQLVFSNHMDTAILNVATPSATGVLSIDKTQVMTATEGDYRGTLQFAIAKTSTALLVSTDAFSLRQGDTQTITATMVNGDGYAITWHSADTAVASVSDGTITGVTVGITTITVTATNGVDTLVKTIAVTIAPANAEDVTVGKPTVSGSTANTEITGDAFFTQGDNGAVNVGASNITLTVTSGDTNVTHAKVSIASDTLLALADTNKDVTFVTDTGTLMLNSDAVASLRHNGTLTMGIALADSNNLTTGSFAHAFELSIADENGASVAFDGAATIAVPCDDNIAWAYHIVDGKIVEAVPVTVVNGVGTFTTTHFSTWALSSREYAVADGDTETEDDGYFLEDGNHYVDVAFWNASSNVASMGDVALTNNRQALVTVKNGIVTTVQMATNPVSMGSDEGTTIKSAVADIKLGSYTGSSVTVLQESTYTTSENAITFKYVQRLSFDYRHTDADQPETSGEKTYATIALSVPDTPMDAVSAGTDYYMDARIRFDWSTATATNATRLYQDGVSANGTEDGEEEGEETVITAKIGSGERVWYEDFNAILESGAELIVIADDGAQARFSQEAMELIAAKAKYSYVQITIAPAKTSDLSRNQRTAIGDHVAYNLTVKAAGNTITDFGDGLVTVSLPCTLQEGESGAGLVIWYVDNAGVIEPIFAHYADGMVQFTVNHFSIYAIGYHEAMTKVDDFIDVTEESWCYDAVRYALFQGLFYGTSDTTFSPDGTMTRSMLVVVLHRLAGLPDPEGINVFADVEDHAWNTDAVIWASENGIVKGYADGTFGGGDAITREQMATFLYRYAGEPVTKGALSGFDDADAVSSYAVDAMTWAVEQGIINGTTTTTLSPQGTATRAQVATIIKRFDQL